MEINSSVIRAVELRGRATAPTIVAAGRQSIPAEAVRDGSIEDPEAVADALQKLWDKAGFRRREVVIGLFNKSILLRLGTLPKAVPEKKLAQAVRFQADEFFPIPPSQMILEHVVIGERRGDKGDEWELLLIGARKEGLEKPLAALQQANLEPIIIDSSPFALMRVLTESQRKGTTLLIDLAPGLTTFLLLVDGIPRFARPLSQNLLDLNIDGRLAQVLGQPKPQPIESQWQGLLSPSSSSARQSVGEQQIATTTIQWPGEEAFQVTDPLQEWATTLANQMRSTLGYYMTQNELTNVNQIVLGGLGATFPGLVEALKRELDAPLSLVDPLQKLTGNVQVQGLDLEREGAEFSTAIGLALRGLED
ncbi:type IV pilus assembly PilM family protein [Heliorestis convoluta]|uniref:Type IV pilus assembly PilM family protein n=1 Tax=Heliorestis convoluta TaxID=356322 RepID=A0A5Q2MYV8_9FIRM|nr:type IV pilus assembly PilM family protein [Heliorestis convoluta]